MATITIHNRISGMEMCKLTNKGANLTLKAIFKERFGFSRYFYTYQNVQGGRIKIDENYTSPQTEKEAEAEAV